MRRRSTLVVALVVVSVVFAGCTGTQGGPGTTPERSTTVQDPERTTTDDPQAGDQLVSVSAVNASVVTEVNASKKASFSALGDAKQDVFLDAYDCSCNVEQTAFSFHDDDQVEYVNYDDQWYFVRVTIV